jgi:hypothetical protein
LIVGRVRLAEGVTRRLADYACANPPYEARFAPSPKLNLDQRCKLLLELGLDGLGGAQDRARLEEFKRTERADLWP